MGHSINIFVNLGGLGRELLRKNPQGVPSEGLPLPNHDRDYQDSHALIGSERGNTR